MYAPGTLALLAPLLAYPASDYRARADQALLSMRQETADARDPFERFCAFVQGQSVEALQELFTRSFDLDPACTLEIGWQLYGEDYRRGEFLVKMRAHLREYGIPESGELPDHMSHAISLLAVLEPDEATEFAGRYVLPALDKMLSGWKERRNEFALLLESVFALMGNQYSFVPLRANSHAELRVLP